MEMKVKYIRDDRKEFDKNSSNFPFKSYIGFYSTGRCTKLLWNISVDNEYYNSTWRRYHPKNRIEVNKGIKKTFLKLNWKNVSNQSYQWHLPYTLLLCII